MNEYERNLLRLEARLRGIRRALIFLLAVMSAILLLHVLFPTVVHAEDYMVVGHNAATGEQVLGVVTMCHSDMAPYEEVCRNDTVQGVVYDQTMRLQVTGRMCGKGRFCVSAGPRQYELAVVE